MIWFFQNIYCPLLSFFFSLFLLQKTSKKLGWSRGSKGWRSPEQIQWDRVPFNKTNKYLRTVNQGFGYPICYICYSTYLWLYWVQINISNLLPPTYSIYLNLLFKFRENFTPNFHNFIYHTHTLTTRFGAQNNLWGSNFVDWNHHGCLGN